MHKGTEVLIDKLSVFFRFVGLGIVLLILLIPLLMISNIVSDRKVNSQRAFDEITRSWPSEQGVFGPIIAIPYKEKVTVEKSISSANGVDNAEKILENKFVSDALYFLPDTLSVDSKIDTEFRYKGIYKKPVYNAELKISGEFILPEAFGTKENLDNITWMEPVLVMGIANARGISGNPVAIVNGKKMDFSSGGYKGLDNLSFDGIHVSLDGYSKPDKEQKLSYEITLNIRGMNNFYVFPLGENTEVNMASNWPHPGFSGNFSPETRTISEDGFSANWKSTWLSSGIPERVADSISNARNGYSLISDNAIFVTFFSGVDVYLQVQRTLKYAALFIFLTFGLFFLVGIVRNLSLHFIQYGMVGSSVAIFYLLLLSLSEHISFTLAYLISSSSCVLLLGYYYSFVFKGIKYCLLSGGALACLYTVLYLIISSEDYALLMGTALLFIMLAASMVFTRNIDWNERNKISHNDINDDSKK